VAILDADKEGFLRSETSLIQTAGRAARHIRGEVLLYADHVTGAMRGALEEMNRRRDAQLEYNKEHGITPTTIVKSVEEVMRTTSVADAGSARDVEELLPARVMDLDREQLMEVLEREMLEAASREEFELAAVFRDRLDELRLSAGKESSSATRSDRIADGSPGPDRGRRGRGRDHRRRR
jgi:excinuclease ABC subunit B